MRRLIAALLAAAALAAGPALAQIGAPQTAPPSGPQALVAAYGDDIARADATTLTWRDGTRMPLGNPAPRDFATMLRDASLYDQLRLPYPAGAPLAPPPVDDDPGRFRNTAFFDHLYGDCRRGEVAPHLVPVVWLPRTWGRTVRFTAVAGAARALAAVSRALDALPPEETRMLYPPAGTYVCRAVADTGRRSMHGWGAAIDINTRFADSWFWHRDQAAAPVWHNVIPPDIVSIFEAHGFIWGGRWYHYDTMHFEYRPELFAHPAPD